MEAKIARRRAKQENSPPRSPDEQLATSLQSSRSVLVSTLLQQWTRIVFPHDVQSFLAAFSDAAQLPQTALFENMCVKYFQHHDLLHITAFRFADELPALGWALCHGSQTTLLRYAIELYNEESRHADFIRPELLEALLEDMYTIPNLDIDARKVAAGILQDVLEYCTAVQAAQPSCPPFVELPLLSEGNDDDEEMLPRGLPNPSVVRTVGTVGAPLPTSRRSSCYSLPGDDSPTLPQLLNSKRIFKSLASADEQDVAPCRTATCSSCEFSEQTLLHVDTVVRFFNMRRSKLWPLTAFQLQLRSVFFGDKYWKRTLNASQQPSVLSHAHSVFALTQALKALYVARQPGTPREDTELRSSLSSTTSEASLSSLARTRQSRLRDAVVKLIRRRRQQQRQPQQQPQQQQQQQQQQQRSERPDHDCATPRKPLHALQLLFSLYNTL